MGYMDQCLELVNTLMLMVGRREAALISIAVEIAPSSALRRRGGRAPARERRGWDERGRGRDGRWRRRRASPEVPEPEPAASEEHSEEDTRENREESDSGRDASTDPEVLENSETDCKAEASQPRMRRKRAMH